MALPEGHDPTRSVGHLTRRAFVGGALASPALAMSGTRSAAARGITFGLTPVFLSNDLDLTDRLGAYLSRTCGTSVQLVTRRTYQEITSLLVSGQLDAAWICGYPYVVFRDQLELVAVPVWRRQPLYQSYIIVPDARPATDIADLAGDVHAFSDPDSNSGFLVTRVAMLEAGLDPTSFFKRTFFTYGHRNVIRAVSSGLAHSGSVDGYVFDVVAQVEPALTKGIKVMRRSELLGFPPIAAPAKPADAGRTSAIRQALLSMIGDPAGKTVLDLLKLDGFTPGTPQIFDGIAEKVARLSGRI
jgi:phosphonate transport system substrate-binding protein